MTEPLVLSTVVFVNDGEPYFLLRARDPQAPAILKQWAKGHRERVNQGALPLDELGTVRDALQCATNMEIWRLDNPKQVA